MRNHSILCEPARTLDSSLSGEDPCTLPQNLSQIDKAFTNMAGCTRVHASSISQAAKAAERDGPCYRTHSRLKTI